jgi:YVTN family beta-propeller protein
VDPEFGTVTGTTAAGGTAFGLPDGTVAVDESSAWVAFGDSTFAQLDASGALLGQTSAGSRPTGVGVGPGAVWVANNGDATVYRYNPATYEQGPVRTVSVGRQPSGLAVAQDAVWVASIGDHAITRIDSTAYSTVTIEVAEEPVAVAVAPDAVWVASRSGVVSRIDPETNEVVATIDVDSAPSGIAAGLGYVWVTAQAPTAT